MKDTNAWLETHGRRVLALSRELEVYKAKGSYGGEINLGSIVTLFNSAIAEITRLQGELNAANDRAEQLDKQIADIFKSPEGTENKE